MKEVSLKSILDTLDAQLPKVTPAKPGVRDELPAGSYQASLSGIRAGTFQKDGRTVAYVSVNWRVLGSADHNDKYNGRTYGWFLSLDGAEDLARFRGFMQAWGLPEAHQNSIRTFLTDLEDPKVFVGKHGPLPAIEFRLAAGKKGGGKVFPNFVRLLESQAEAAVSDHPASEERTTETKEEQAYVIEPEQVDDADVETLRTFLAQIGVKDADIPTDEAILRESSKVASQILYDEEPTWTDGAIDALKTAFGVKEKGAKAKAELFRVIAEAV